MPRDYRFLTVSDCEALLQELARVLHPEREGAVETFRLLGRRHGLAMLQSALAEPRQGFGGRYLHRTLFDKAGALFRSLAKDHPLEDGNERLALAATAVFLLLNGWLLTATQDEAVEYTRGLVSVTGKGGRLTPPQVGHWLRRHAVRLDDVVDDSKRAELAIPADLSLSLVMPAIESLRESLQNRPPRRLDQRKGRE